MICIFCLVEKPPSKEHVIADALGGTLEIDRVCQKCNNELGQDVDNRLTDHPLAIMGRMEYGLSDDARSFSKIFGDGTISDSDGTIVATQSRTAQIVDEHGNSRQVYRAWVKPKVSKTTNEQGEEVITGVFDESDESHARSLIRTALERQGSYLDDDAFEVEYEKHIRRGTLENKVDHTIQISRDDFKRPIMKIAYEMAWFWLGDKWLGDINAIGMRRYIRGEKSSLWLLDQVIELGPGTWPFELAQPTMHVVAITDTAAELCISIQIFRHFYANVVISTTPARYADSHAFSNDGKVMLFRRAAPREEIDLSTAIGRQTN